jgi:AcrR family transcriptional regulator
MPKVYPEYKEEAKKRILMKAARLFAEQGYHATTMDGIAKAVGVSKGALYLYFDSKETLFAELASFSRSSSYLSSPLFLDADPEVAREFFQDKSLEELIAAIFDFWVMTMDSGFWNLSVEITAISLRDERLNAIVSEDMREDVAILARFLEEQQQAGVLDAGIDAPSLARKMIVFFWGLFFQMCFGLERDEARRLWIEAASGWVQA